MGWDLWLGKSFRSFPGISATRQKFKSLQVQKLPLISFCPNSLLFYPRLQLFSNLSMKIKHPSDLDLLSFVIIVVIVAVCFILFCFNIFMDCISRVVIVAIGFIFLMYLWIASLEPQSVFGSWGQRLCISSP